MRPFTSQKYDDTNNTPDYGSGVQALAYSATMTRNSVKVTVIICSTHSLQYNALVICILTIHDPESIQCIVMAINMNTVIHVMP